MLNPNRILPRLVAGVAITVAGAQVVLSAHQARPEPAVARMAAQGDIAHANGPSLDLACHLGLSAGENVGFTSSGINDGQLNQMFMNSPEHRANILGAYHFVGAAWAVAANGYAYLAVEFG